MKDKQLLTALELLNQKNGLKVSSIKGSIVINVDEIVITMIEFAKMHVEKQKEEIYKKVRKVDYSNLKNCVYNAYPIDLIK